MRTYWILRRKKDGYVAGTDEYDDWQVLYRSREAAEASRQALRPADAWEIVELREVTT